MNRVEPGPARPLVAVLDYGIGNLHSAQKAIETMGADARLTTDAGLIADADGVVLPGVGAFGACMNTLRSTGLEQPALEAVASGRPFLGICVGMQMLFDASEEDDRVTGAGYDPRHDPLDPSRRQTSADAVEPTRSPPPRRSDAGGPR